MDWRISIKNDEDSQSKNRKENEKNVKGFHEPRETWRIGWHGESLENEFQSHASFNRGRGIGYHRRGWWGKGRS